MTTISTVSFLTPILIPVIVLGCLSSIAAEWRPNERPVIVPPGQIIKKSMEVLYLKCSGSYPVAWDLQGYEADERVEVKTVNETGSSPPFFTTSLTIKNLTFMDRQTFVCYFITADNSLNFGEVSADVFIDDPEHLLVSMESAEMVVIDVNKGMKNVIPYCKPTHPDVRMTLLHYGRDVLELPSWSYTIENGFTVDPVVTQTEGLYICSARRGRKTQELTLYFVVTVAAGLKRHPTINSTLARAIPVGSTFVLDCLTESDRETFFQIKWTEPEDVIKSERATVDIRDLSSNSHNKKYSARLTVVNASIEDGLKDYVCTVSVKGVNYSANDTVSIFAPGQEYLEVNASHDGNITANASKEEEAIWIIDVFGFPRPDNFYWKNSKGAELTTGAKSRYSLFHHVDKNQVSLIIDRVTMQDSGGYQFTAENSYMSKTIDLFLTVRDSPQVLLTGNRTYFGINQMYKFLCRATGYPYPGIEWYFKQCEPDNVEESKCGPFQRFQPTHPPMNIAYNDAPRSTIQETFFRIPGTGYILCAANNSLGVDEEAQLIVAVDFPESGKSGFGVHGLDGEANTEPIETETATYICSASKLNFTSEIHWYYQNGVLGQEIRADEMEGVKISEKTTGWSYQSQLMIEEIGPTFNGTYRCAVESLSIIPPISSASIKVAVRQMVPPVIIDSNLNSTKITTGSTWNTGKLYCNATGVPEPGISWFKDDVPIEYIPKLQDEVVIGKNFIDFKGLSSEYSGRYSCRASNRVGTAEQYVDIEVKKEVHWGLILCLIGLVIILCCVSGIATYQYYRDQKMKRWIKKLHLQDFENGDIEKINPDEGVESQVNLLPYDKKYEFPRERLKLGIRIGSGAFGQVVQADAMGIVNGETRTTVAVKMVKPNSDDSHFMALMSELKIMVHLGPHVNVVNLLGACTKQLFKNRELLVIVEYCKYGSLLSYLHRHRKDFIDQLDRNLDIVDAEVCFPIEQCQSPVKSGPECSRVTANGYHTMRELMEHPELRGTGRRPDDVGRGQRTSDDYALSTHVRSVCTDMSYLSNSPTVVGTDGRKRSSSSSTFNGHYRGVYQYRDVQPITTTDLLCWCFQIARGMDYLASRNVLHGDLAARNVLLAENNVVKICDFGLAREMYEEKYRKKTEVPLPIKWMALESIYYRVFSTQSDIWSFGVVMWELFTLGKNPYPGMEPDEQFYSSLSQGYRMEKPNYAPSSIYDLMCACWDKEPSCRPSFTAISDRIGDLMQEGLRNHYMDLNVPYIRLNRERMEGREDLLEKMSGPDFSSVSKRATPDRSDRSYANLTAEQQPTSDYLIPRSARDSNTLLVPPQTYGNYQNVESPEDPRLQCLANNAGYVYMNKDLVGPEDVFSPRPPSSGEEEPSQRFGFDSANNISEERPMPDHGISNINYVPNTIFIAGNKGPAPIEDLVTHQYPEDDDSVRSNEGKRHKNDSGVSSIDSNFETSLKRTPPPPNPTFPACIWNGGDFIDNSDPHQGKQFQPQIPFLPLSNMTSVTE